MADRSHTHTDGELIKLVQKGSSSAFDELYRRHAHFASCLARTLTRSRHDADDISAEAFVKLFELLRRGSGPEEKFRPYLCSMIRNLANDHHRFKQRVGVSDELELIEDVGWEDPVLADADRSAAVSALQKLPEPWKRVLWEIEVLDRRPRVISATSGMTAHAVSSLGHRARESLRDAYLSEFSTPKWSGCEPTNSRLGAYVRGRTRPRETARIERHLQQCDSCGESLDEVRELNSCLFPAARKHGRSKANRQVSAVGVH